MANLKNTTISSNNGFLEFPVGNTASRPSIKYITQSFTAVGTTSWTAPAGVASVEVLVVAGGGAGGRGSSAAYPSCGGEFGGGGGGAGGLIYRSNYPVTFGSSYTVTVGAGGAASDGGAGLQRGPSGGNSVFDTLTAVGGGGGGAGQSSGQPGAAGGSGGGGGSYSISIAPGAGTPGQGHAGGIGLLDLTGNGGGGGAGAPGFPSTLDTPNKNGDGGPGLSFAISGTPTWYAGGGGGGGAGGGQTSILGRGGIGGGGNGATLEADDGQDGQANTGGGGGGTRCGRRGAGGSGIVVIRYSVTSDNQNPIGYSRFNTDINGVEIYQNSVDGWVSQDPSKNYAGQNLMQYSQEIDQTVWSKSNVTVPSVNVISAPDGTQTADLLQETATTGQHFLFQFYSTNVVAGRIYTQSVYLKKGPGASPDIIQLTFGAAAFGTDQYANFNLNTGTVTGFSGIQAEIKNEEDGWYRCIFSATATSSVGAGVTSGVIVAFVNNNPTSTRYGSYAGSTNNNVYVWGGQSEENEFASQYIYTENSFVPTPYRFNDYLVHRYTKTGTSSFVPAVSGTVEVLVVGGGGGGGAGNTGSIISGGGGGGGGVIYNKSYPVRAGRTYRVVVGDGGLGTQTNGGLSSNGQNSVFGSLIAIGGGGGGTRGGNGGTFDTVYESGFSGGSGGGGSYRFRSGDSIINQGNPGGDLITASVIKQPAGGGGGGGQGWAATYNSSESGVGGPGFASDISGELTWYAGGGAPGEGSQVSNGQGGLPGIGGGGIRGVYTTPARTPGGNAQANTGGGGGAGPASTGQTFEGGGTGGSGIVIVRYKNY
jgi:hypothetical protein